MTFHPGPATTGARGPDVGAPGLPITLGLVAFADNPSKGNVMRSRPGLDNGTLNLGRKPS